MTGLGGRSPLAKIGMAGECIYILKFFIIFNFYYILMRR